MAEEISAAVLIPIIISDATHSPTLQTPPQGGSKMLTIKTLQGKRLVPLHSEMILTVRTHTVENFKGHISFPGGLVERQDNSLQTTALRETREELGLSEDLIEIIGELPQVPTLTKNYIIKPFVGLLDKMPILKPNPHEIAEVIKVPLSFLINPVNARDDVYEYLGVRYKLKSYHYNGTHKIWGATARIIQNFIATYLGGPHEI